MRISLGLVAALLLASVATERARAADPGAILLIWGNLPGEGSANQISLERLEAALNDFAARVRANQSRILPPFPSFQVERREGLSRLVDGQWSPRVIAMMWGETGTRSASFRPAATVDIGRLPVLSVLPAGVRSNRFGPVRAIVSRTSAASVQANELGVYQAVIGYALLVRAWDSQPGMVQPIAMALGQSIRDARRRAGTGSSLCLVRIEEGMNEIIAKARNGRPNLGAARAPSLSFFPCENE